MTIYMALKNLKKNKIPRRKTKKAVVLLSGGLDSRLAVKIMQKQGFKVIALFFKLPFTGCCNEKCSFNFSQISGVELKTIDCTKGKLLQEYLRILKKPKYSRGTSMNPCIDCRIFMLKKAKEFADKQNIELIATGEVLGERPMSQNKKALEIVEDESGLKGRLLRPLSAKLLPKTNAEEKGIVDREKLYDISGRRRLKQIALARKFKISYPNPGGGCLLCEKAMKKRLEYALKRGMNDKEIKLLGLGRHFLINNSWVVIGRNKEENDIIEKIGKDLKKQLIFPEKIGPTGIILDKADKKTKDKVKELIEAYSKGSSIQKRKKFQKYSL